MTRRSICFAICLIIFTCVWSCATAPRYNFPQGTRVGIINLLEPQVTHQNFTSFATKNFTKTYEVDWDIPAYAKEQLITELKKDARFSIVKINLSERHHEKTLRSKMVEMVLLSQSHPPAIPPQGAHLLDALSNPNDVQVVILIGSFKGPSPYRTNTEEFIDVEGYGLFTRKLFSGKLGSIFDGLISFRKAYAYAQIGVIVYKVQPTSYITAARAIRKGRQLRPINDFNWDADIRNLSPSALNQLKNPIEEYINEAIKRALRNAGLARSRPLKEDTGIGGAPSR